jgi:hypothetical protein
VSKTLRESGATIGTVTHTFPNSVYVRTLTNELVFITNRSLKSPITINVDSISNIQDLIKPQEQVSTSQNEIKVGNGFSINLRKAEDYNPQSNLIKREPRFAEIKEALRSIVLILRVVDTTSSILDEPGLAHTAASEFVQKEVTSLKSSQVNTLGESQNLVGLGLGFTPSGDDMLGGFLAVYNSFTNSIGRPQILLSPQMLERTTWISAKLLDYMQKLILDEQLSRIIEVSLSGDADEIVLAFEAILPRGHTSGVDIAVGAALGLGVVHDVALRAKETEGVAEKLGLMDSPLI